MEASATQAARDSAIGPGPLPLIPLPGRGVRKLAAREPVTLVFALCAKPAAHARIDLNGITVGRPGDAVRTPPSSINIIRTASIDGQIRAVLFPVDGREVLFAGEPADAEAYQLEFPLRVGESRDLTVEFPPVTVNAETATIPGLSLTLKKRHDYLLAP